MSKKKFVIRHYWTAWVDIPVEAEDLDEAYELADELYNEGEYEENPENFENTDVEDVTEEYYGEGRRNSPLAVGDKVFDAEAGYWGHITEIDDDGVYHLEMTPEDENENRIMFNSKLTKEDCAWETDDEDSLYQIAYGILGRDGNPVCFEHQFTKDKYPYFSPYLNENLFESETLLPFGDSSSQR